MKTWKRTPSKKVPRHYKYIREKIEDGLLIVILGIGGSGKSALATDLSNAYFTPRIRTYTTKPPSKWDAEKYRFISTEVFEFKRKRGDLTLVKKVTVPSNDDVYVSKYHYYGTDDSIIHKGGIIVLDWEGYIDLLSMRQSNMVAFILEIDINTAYRRKLSSSPIDIDARDNYFKRLTEEKELLNPVLIDNLALDFKIYKIDAKSGRDKVFREVDSVLKGL